MITVKKKTVERRVLQEATLRTGDRFRVANSKIVDHIVYTLLFPSGLDKAIIFWTRANGEQDCTTYEYASVQKYIENGEWVLVEGDGK